MGFVIGWSVHMDRRTWRIYMACGMAFLTMAIEMEIEFLSYVAKCAHLTSGYCSLAVVFQVGWVLQSVAAHSVLPL